MKHCLPRGQRPFARHQSGQTLLEYGIIVALVSVAVLGAIAGLELAFRGGFQRFIDNTPTSPPELSNIGGDYATRWPTPTPVLTEISVVLEGPVYVPLTTEALFDSAGTTSPNGTITSYTWTLEKTDDPTQSATINGDRLRYTFPTAGNWNVTLAVQDAAGYTGTRTLPVIVFAPGSPNFPPIALIRSVEPRLGTAPLTVTFDGGLSDDDAGIVEYRWDMGNGAIRLGEQLTFTYATPGVYDAYLIVTDAEGEQDASAPVTIVVEPPPPTEPPPPADQPPSANIVANITNGRAPLLIQFEAQASDDVGVTQYQWSFGDTNGSIAQNPSHIYRDAGSYTVRLTVVDTAGQGTTVTLPVQIGSDCATPGPWTAVDIGRVENFGHTCGSPGRVEIEGSGADISGSRDSFHFAYQTLTGDFTLVTQVTGMTAATDWSKAGVVVRAGLVDNAPMAALLVSGHNRLLYDTRSDYGAGVESLVNSGNGGKPLWLRIQRQGTRFIAATSPDGSNWTTVAEDDIFMGDQVYVGLGVTSGVNGLFASAVFENSALNQP